MDNMDNRDYVIEMKNLMRRYQRHDVEDNALAELKQRLDLLYQDYDRFTPKLPQRLKGQEEFNTELNDIAKDFVNNKEKLIDIFSDRSKNSRFNKFKQNHTGATKKQDYIDYIEQQKEFEKIIGDLIEFDSEQIHTFYEIGKSKKLDTQKINKIISDTYKKNQGKNLTLDRLALNIRRNLRKGK